MVMECAVLTGPSHRASNASLPSFPCSTGRFFQTQFHRFNRMVHIFIINVYSLIAFRFSKLPLCPGNGFRPLSSTSNHLFPRPAEHPLPLLLELQEMFGPSVMEFHLYYTHHSLCMTARFKFLKVCTQ